MANVLIRCDASKEIGLGHVTRCLALANDFKIRGHNVCFAMKNFSLGINKVKEKDFAIFTAPEDNFSYSTWINKLVKNNKIAIFIGDIRDGFPIETIKELKAKGILTVAIDELSEYAKECDICFYPPHSQINQHQYNGKVYQGWEYVMLREEFYKRYKKVVNKTQNILVMMGGTDPYRLALKTVKQLLKLQENFDISVIISKNHPEYKEIENIDKKVTVYSDIDNMAEFLTAIDFGIISFGVSAYELAVMHIPAIHICLDEDHMQSSSYFTKNKFAIQISKDLISDSNLIDFDINLKKNDLKQCKIVPTILKEINNAI